MPANTDSFDTGQLNTPLCVFLADQGKTEASTGAELEPPEAKEAGKASERNKEVPQIGPDDADIEDQIVSLLEEGRKTLAVKLYRRQAGVSLQAAKDTVEALAIKYDISPKAAGCAGMVLLVIAVSAIIGVGARFMLL